MFIMFDSEQEKPKHDENFLIPSIFNEKCLLFV